MKYAVTARHGAVATRSATQRKPPAPAVSRPTLSALCKPGWLLRGTARLVELPPALRPYSGPENRSQFLDRPKSAANRGGRR